MLAANFENHVIVCGLGNVGVRVQHLRQLNNWIVVIEAKQRITLLPTRRRRLRYSSPLYDARDTRLLENANATKPAASKVTNDDMVNLETALNAHSEYNSEIKVIIRMFDQKLAKKVQKRSGYPCCLQRKLICTLRQIIRSSGNQRKHYRFIRIRRLHDQRLSTHRLK